jgi:hypothetical protein
VGGVVGEAPGQGLLLGKLFKKPGNPRKEGV